MKRKHSINGKFYRNNHGILYHSNPYCDRTFRSISNTLFYEIFQIMEDHFIFLIIDNLIKSLS